MLLQPRNLYDPIEYMIKRMMKKQSVGSGTSPPLPPSPGDSCCNCLDAITPIELIREKGRLKRILAASFTVDLFYGKTGLLERIVGQCDNGYRLEIELIFEKGILVRVEPTETEGDSPPPTPPAAPMDALTVTEAEAWAMSKGVIVSYGDETAQNLIMANIINRGMWMVAQAGYGYPYKVIVNNADLTEAEKQSVPGYYKPSDNSININPVFDWTTLGALTQQQYDAGFWSTPNDTHVIIHELGHYMHFKHLATTGRYIIDDTIPAGCVSDCSDFMSTYGMSSKFEFVAEYFVVKVEGISWDSVVTQWYNQFWDGDI